MPTFNVIEGGMQEAFLASRVKIQVFGGGFANGKTASACIKALELAKDYPGSNGLIARSTYPKLNDTIRKEFLKWCPEGWIKSFPRSQNASNTCTLQNGTTINFRYIAQQGKATGEATTSNLLSATYDWIVVDQIEDPEIVYKDFLDLLGRLRGMAKYVGDDPTMPPTGPRYFIITCNPTRNWVYKKIAKPYHDWVNEKKVSPDLLCDTDKNGAILLDEDGNPTPIIEIFEASTYENQDNLEPDFIKALEASYKGQMRDRYLLGLWAAYEGLVYPQFQEAIHVMSHESILDYYKRLRVSARDRLTIIEGYDYGMAVPFCYMYGFVDDKGNVFILDGSYDAEVPVAEAEDSQVSRIMTIRDKYDGQSKFIKADPSIFRRSAGKKVVGISIARFFAESNILMERGNANINNGIVKVGQYLNVYNHHQNPITGQSPAPYVYFSDKLEFLFDEFNGYYWKRDTVGDIEEKPIDKNDHAMDTLKYMFTDRPPISKIVVPEKRQPVGWRRWGEMDIRTDTRISRHRAQR